MNLVQINERLKDLPSQVIQQYANGMNPEVPPYLALAEMQRRETAQKQMATAQGSAQGPQPSVKEQMEQKAGLMAAQALQQQQMQQQMQQPQGPMPVPAGVPQPQMQPQAPQAPQGAMMAARGGLARAPVSFDFQHGGIVAFQSGGRAPRIQDEVPISDEERERLQRELLMRLVGEETRNPPERRQPMQITESDTSTVPGLESGDLMARALAEARGPQPDNRGMINRIEARDARHAAMLEREREKSANRPKYETPYDRLNRENRGELTEEEQKKRAMIESLISQIPRDKNIVQGGERVEGSELERNIRNTAMALPGASASRALSGSAGSARGVAAGLAALSDRGEAPYSNEGRRVPEAPQASYSNEGRQPPVGLPAALQRAAPPVERPPAPAVERPPVSDAVSQMARPMPTPGAQQPGAQRPAGLPGALPPAAQGNVSPYIEETAKMARREPTAPTAAGIIAEQTALSPAAMQESAMKKRADDARARAAEERDLFEKTRPSGLDDLIRVFGQAGQYKGLSGTGPAYTANQQQKRAEELAMQRRQNELLTGIEGREYEGAKELYGARAKSMESANKSYQDRLTSNTKALADLAGVDQRRMDESANRLSNMEIAKLREATANRSAAEKQRFEASYLAKKSQARDFAAKGDPASMAAAARLEAEASDMLAIRGGAAAGERNDIAAEKAVQSSLLKELSDNLRMDAATRARKQAELDESTERLRQLSGGATKPSSAQAGKVPPPPPGFKVN